MESVLITGKSLYALKTVFLVLLVAVLLSCITACSEKEDDDTYKYLFSDISSELDEDEDGNKIERYTVIVAKGSSSEVYEAANGICKRIKDKTGIYSELCYDSDKLSNTKNVCRVLVGKSKYTDIFLRDYKVNDFGYCYLDGTIFIGGISEEATLKAVSKFNEDILDRNIKVLMRERDSFYSKGEYEIGHAELNGVELDEYVIAYDSGDSVAYSEALLLRENIASHTGYYLNILKDSSCSDETKAICVGRTALNDIDNGYCAENEARIIPHPNGISVVSDTHYGLKLGLSKLSGILLDADDSGESHAQIEQNIHISFSSVSADILDIDISDADMSIDELDALLDRVYIKQADFVIVRGISERSINYFSSYFSDTYEINEAIGGDEGIYYLHLKEKFTLDSISNKGVEGLDAVHMVYVSKLSSAKIDMFEVYPHESCGEDTVNRAAGLVKSFLKGKDMGTVMISSAFENADEGLFADKIAPVSSISAICGEPELIEHRVYLSGMAFELDDFSAEECYNSKLYFKSFTIYGR